MEVFQEPGPVGDEPELADEDDDNLQHYDEAYARQYENEHTWEQLQEDEHGNLRLDRVAEQRAKRKRLLSAVQSARIRKGMIRYLLLAIDLSRGASAQDLRPNRLACMLRICKTFIRDFFDQNPLSQLGILFLKDGVAEKLTELSGSPETQIKKLSESQLGASGDASLQNVLELSASTLKPVPPYGHREVLILFAGLSTCDPGNIFTTVKACKDARIRVSVVGVAAEVYVCKRIAEDTGGTYGVALSEGHLEELMLGHAPPPPATSAHAGAELVRMGFPQRNTEDQAAAVYVGPDVKLMAAGYTCPRCRSRVGELPCECHVCGLTLISSPHLARSYHHLFPVLPFEELSAATICKLLRLSASKPVSAGTLPHGGTGNGNSLGLQEQHEQLACFGCMRDLSAAVKAAQQAAGSPTASAVTKSGPPAAAAVAVPMVLQCTVCKHAFCYECDNYVHESLHNCPGCEVHGTGTGQSHDTSL